MDKTIEYIAAFAVGGALCLAGQLLISLTSLTPARILVVFVTAGAVLTAIGATVPLTGIGYALAKGAMEGAAEHGFFGAVSGGVSAASAGITAAVFFGYIFALIFKPRTKR